MTLAESLWKRVDMSRGADACWPWTGCRKPSGTGLVSWQGRTLSAHRAAWSVTLGPVPAGAAVRHRCGSPACCNPAQSGRMDQVEVEIDQAIRLAEQRAADLREAGSAFTGIAAAYRVRQIEAALFGGAR